MLRTLDEFKREEIEPLLVRDEFFWLDLDSPGDDELDAMGTLLGWHERALEDAKEFGQRPKLDDYDNHALLVFYGVHAPDGRLVEVHVFVSGGWVVTLHRDPCHHLQMQHKLFGERPPKTEEQVVYAILDRLTDSFAPCLVEIDEEIEQLEDEIVRAPDDKQVGAVLDLRRRVGPMRRVANAERDLFVSVEDVIARLPGLERDAAHNFRDVADHLHRTAEALDSQRDRLAGALQIYSSMSDHNLNRVSERLTLVATVFLPLTFTVGFFGQNFGWLVRHIDSFGDFLVWGVGIGLVVPLVAIYLIFLRAGWVKGPVVSPALRKRTDED